MPPEPLIIFYGPADSWQVISDYTLKGLLAAVKNGARLRSYTAGMHGEPETEDDIGDPANGNYRLTVDAKDGYCHLDYTDGIWTMSTITREEFRHEVAVDTAMDADDKVWLAELEANPPSKQLILPFGKR